MYGVLLCIHCRNDSLLVNREDQFSTQQRKGVRERGMIEGERDDREREVNRSYLLFTLLRGGLHTKTVEMK